MASKKAKKVYTVTEAAAALGVTRAAVHRAVKEGRLKAHWGKIELVQKVLLVSYDELKSYQVSTLHQTAGKKNS